MGFELAQDAAYGDERWLEVRTPNKAVRIVLGLRQGARPKAPEGLPRSNVMFYCDELPGTYEELRARGVVFPQPPVEQPFSWWSIFEDGEGNGWPSDPGARSRRSRRGSLAQTQDTREGI
jgi:lactoylglutathione lyase